MLSEEEKTKILEEIKHFPHKSAVCIEALKIVQKNKRWISDESLKDVAEILDMTTAEVDSIASFYSRIYRKPVGEHVILLCDSVSCWVMGYEDLLIHLNNKLGINYGETTPDGKFTLLSNTCLGNCDKAPCIMIDEKTFDNVTTDMLDKLINEYQ